MRVMLTRSREPSLISSSSPMETRAAVPHSARIIHPLTLQLSDTRRRLLQPQRLVFHHPTWAPVPPTSCRTCCPLLLHRPTVCSCQVHLLGYEDGGLSAADYNTVTHPLTSHSICIIHLMSRQVLRDVVQQLRLAQADVVISFFPFAPAQIAPHLPRHAFSRQPLCDPPPLPPH